MRQVEDYCLRHLVSVGAVNVLVNLSIKREQRGHFERLRLVVNKLLLRSATGIKRNGISVEVGILDVVHVRPEEGEAPRVVFTVDRVEPIKVAFDQVQEKRIYVLKIQAVGFMELQGS